MTKIRLLPLLVCCLASCAHGDVGLKAQSVAIIEQNLVVGETTEQHALEMFGQPRNTKTQELSDIWTYDLNTDHISPTDVMPVIQLFSMHMSTNVKALVLQFNAAKQLENWTYVETALAQYHGV